MSHWKNVITQLANAGKILARWHLNSGAAPFMYIPTENILDIDTINPTSDVSFDEITHLDILNSIKVGSITIKNDVDKCKIFLESIAGVRVYSIAEGIRIELSDM
jgi:hypothetical protein